MHYAHVKRKEKPMNPVTLEEFHNNPALRRRLFAMAHRERNAAIRAGLHWLRERLVTRFRSLTHPPQWIGRLG